MQNILVLSPGETCTASTVALNEDSSVVLVLAVIIIMFLPQGTKSHSQLSGNSQEDKSPDCSES